MGPIVEKIRRIIALGLTNTLLRGTHAFGIKRGLLRWGGVIVGEGSCIVGPLHLGTVASLQIGRGCWIGRDFTVEGNGSVVIGDNVDVAPQVTFLTGGHSVGSHERRAGNGEIYSQAIGDGSWVCAQSTFVGDLIVGKGSVIAARAMVIEDVPSDVLVAGVPGKIKKSFQLKRLTQFAQ
ncbi:MAG: acyltransferase [Olegusella sp.]|nr:acyltransferase [Olegusella sp.]